MQTCSVKILNRSCIYEIQWIEKCLVNVQMDETGEWVSENKTVEFSNLLNDHQYSVRSEIFLLKGYVFDVVLSICYSI